MTYSPASWDAVPSAATRLTAEFGMGSGVSRSLWPPDRIKAPWKRLAPRKRAAKGFQHQVVCIRVSHTVLAGGLAALRGVVHASLSGGVWGCLDLRLRKSITPCPSLDRIKPVGRLVPVN